jgi:hypothetical protein
MFATAIDQSRDGAVCTYLAAILLVGLLLNALFGLWWAEPLAALIMVPIIAKEGVEGLQGRACSDGCAVTLIDHQAQMLFGVGNFERQGIIESRLGRYYHHSLDACREQPFTQATK